MIICLPFGNSCCKCINLYRRRIFSRQFYDFRGWGLSRWVRELLFQILFIEFQCLYFCLYLRFLNRITLGNMYYRKMISKSRDYNWRLRRKRVNWWINSGHAYKGNNTICLVDVTTVIILVFYFICLVSIAILFPLVTLLSSLLLLRKTLTLQLLLLLRVLFLLREFFLI